MRHGSRIKVRTVDQYLARLSDDQRAALEKLRRTIRAAAPRAEESPFDTSKGTIRFQPDHPLPAALVRKLVKARIAEKDRRAR